MWCFFVYCSLFEGREAEGAGGGGGGESAADMVSFCKVVTFVHDLATDLCFFFFFFFA